MLNYIEFLNTPTGIASAIVCVFLAMQIIGEVLEFKGKVVPEILKVRKFYNRRKKERETIEKVPEMLSKAEKLLTNVEEHYNNDNIEKRNEWITWVNTRAKEYDSSIKDLEKKMDENNKITLSLLVDNKRDSIIAFASRVIDGNYPVTREQFKRVFKLYEEYETIIKEHKLTNGEVDIAHRIIAESYENHLKNNSFVEDIRGYNNANI